MNNSTVTRIENKIFCETCGEHVELSKYRMHLRYAHKSKDEVKEKKKYKKQLACEICFKIFTSKYNLKYHLAHHLNLKNFICDQCPNAYNTQADLNQHRRTHEKPNGSFTCPDCGEFFEYQYKFDFHVRSVHQKNSTSNQCDICQKTFSFSWHLNEHKKKIHGEKKEKKEDRRIFECQECNKVFMLKHSMQIHVDVVHRGLKKYNCLVCDKAFGSPKDRRKHEVLHEKGRSTTYCTYCRRYVTGDILVHDESVHGNFKFTCDICKRKFYSEQDFRRHKLVKHAFKKYICDLCGAAHSDKYHIRLHIQAHIKERSEENGDGKILNCKICGKRFNYARSVIRHILAVHEKVRDFECDVCGRRFGDKGDLNKHMNKIHACNEKFCKICEKDIENDNIDKHYEIVHGNFKFKCEICSTGFKSMSSLIYHNKLKHTIEKKKRETMNCPYCDKEYKTMVQFNRHIKTHFPNEEDENDTTLVSPEIVTVKMEKFEEDELIIFDMKNETMIEAQRQEKKEEKRRDGNDIMNEEVEHDVFDTYESEDDKIFPLDLNLKEEKKEFEVIKVETVDRAVIHEQHVKNEPENSSIKHHMDFDISQALAGFKDFPLKKDGKRLQVKCKLCWATFSSVFEYRDHFVSNHAYDHEKDILLSESKVSKSRRRKAKNKNQNNKRKAEKEKQNQLEISKALGKSIKYFPEINNGLKLQIRCKLCFASFPSIIRYRAHFVKMHYDENDDNFECKECNEKFDDKTSHNEHFLYFHKTFKCANCKRAFFSQFELDSHVRKDHNMRNTQQVCTFCGKVYANQTSLNVHLTAVHSESRFECDMCDRSYSFKSALYKHRQIVHFDVKKHNCDECNYAAGSKHEIRMHKIRHHNFCVEESKNKIYCGECKSSFPNESVLKRHMYKVHGGKLYRQNRQCPICLEPTPSSYKTDKHYAQVHLNGKKMMRKCGYCQVEVKLYQELIDHLKTHPGVFICIVCGDPFYTQQALDYHSEAHRMVEKKLRKFECDHCGHKTFTKIQMKVHVSQHMIYPEMHYCEVCGKGFRIASSLYTHRKYHEEGKINCTYCDKKFVRNFDLVHHVRKEHTHEKPFKCTVCSMQFIYRYQLKLHRQTHPETMVVYKCDECNISFGNRKLELAAHDHIHHPEKRPFRCHICDKSFVLERTFEKHNKKHSSFPA